MDTAAVTAIYNDCVENGEIERDRTQVRAAAALDRLAAELVGEARNGRYFLGVFRRNTANGNKPVRGLYLYGGVGRGKTMLMDMFFETVDIPKKRRLHFHEFLAEVHERIATARMAHDGDPIPTVAAEIAKETCLLCFDELHVTDIADAMILGRLFTGLFERAVVVVATSNAHPDDLYKDGLNRQLFEPFIALVQEHTLIFELDAAKDFRLDKLHGRELYFVPADASADEQMDAHWHRLTGDHPSLSVELEVKGRKLHVPMASMGVARFTFDDLCAQPLASLDYLRIAHEFHTLLIDHIPTLTPQNRNEARRFINLIDTLYDCRITLVASADAEPHDLYVSGDGADLFARTASRLSEMRSESYIASRANNALAKV